MNKRNIYLMYAISFLQGMVFYGSIATLYRQANGVSILQITIIESISLILCLILEIPWGIIADKIGYKKTLVICSTLYFISKIIFWKATNFTDFLIERILLSVVISGLSGVDTSILYLSCTKEKSHDTFAIYDSLGQSGLFFSSFIFVLFIGNNYKLSAFLTVISYGIAFVLSLFIIEVKDNKKTNQTNTFKEFYNILFYIIKNKYTLMFIIGIALFNETHQTITVFLNQIQYTKSGINNQTIGVIFILANIINMLSIFSAKTTKLIGAKNLIKICYISVTVVCIILALTSNAIISVLGILIIKLFYALLQPLQINLQNIQVKSSNRATTLSIFSMTMSCIGATTNIIFGAMAQKNISLSFICGCVFCLIGLILITIWFDKTKNEFII